MNNNIKIIDFKENENGEEVIIYEYKGTQIDYNEDCEHEYSIYKNGECWYYSTLEDAIKAINKEKI